MLREEFMVPMKLSSHALARAIGVTPARVNDIANEKRGITADTALRFGRYFGTTAGVWINLQKRFELETPRRKPGDALQRLHPRAA
ncbi:HigA family addiction module antitoxin [Dyella tabacisoli]